MVGTINKTWFENSMQNVCCKAEIVDWFTRATNKEIEIDDELAVWAGGTWLSQEQIDEICAKIDKGV